MPKHEDADILALNQDLAEATVSQSSKIKKYGRHFGDLYLRYYLILSLVQF